MDKRILQPLIAGLLVAVLIFAFRVKDPRADSHAVHVGSEAPTVWSRVASEGVVIGWTFETEDCFSCNRTVEAFRRLQRKFGPELKFASVAVEVDSATARLFFRRERVSTQLTHLGRAEYLEQFGSNPISTVYLIKDQVVHAVHMPPNAQDANSNTRIGYSEFEQEVSRILRE